MRRKLMRGELRLHHVAALPAKLDRLHVGHGAVGYLASDQNVEHRHCTEENRDTPPARSAIVNKGELCADATMRKRYSDWDEDQTQDEHHRDRDEDQQPNVGIVHLSA